MKLIRIGVDLAKSIFQVHGVDRLEQAVWRRKLSRGEWLKALLERIEPGCQIGMESCAGAHHWARQMEAKGFTVKLIALQFVKPYVKSHKNDANDAEASRRRALTSRLLQCHRLLWQDCNPRIVLQNGCSDPMPAFDSAVGRMAT